MELDGKSGGQRAASLYRHRRRRYFKTRRPLRRSAFVDAFEGIRPCAERGRTGLGQHPNSPTGAAGPRVQNARPHRGAAAQPLRLLPRRADVRNASARRHRAGPRPSHGVARRRKVDPRSNCLPEDSEGAGHDGRRAVGGGHGSNRSPRHSAEAIEDMKSSFAFAALTRLGIGRLVILIVIFAFFAWRNRRNVVIALGSLAVILVSSGFLLMDSWDYAKLPLAALGAAGFIAGLVAVGVIIRKLLSGVGIRPT